MHLSRIDNFKQRFLANSINKLDKKSLSSNQKTVTHSIRFTPLKSFTGKILISLSKSKLCPFVPVITINHNDNSYQDKSKQERQSFQENYTNLQKPVVQLYICFPTAFEMPEPSEKWKHVKHLYTMVFDVLPSLLHVFMQ